MVTGVSISRTGTVKVIFCFSGGSAIFINGLPGIATSSVQAPSTGMLISATQTCRSPSTERITREVDRTETPSWFWEKECNGRISKKTSRQNNRDK
jgi:hypothetical protein